MEGDQPITERPTGDRSTWVDYEGTPVPPSVAERLTAERETRAGEVLDLAVRATNSLRYGFSEAAYGSDHPEMMGVVFMQEERGEQHWKHVPLSRIQEAVQGLQVDFVHDASQGARARVTRGSKTWEMPAIRWDVLQGNAHALDFIPVVDQFGIRRVPDFPAAAYAKITPIAFRTPTPRSSV